jgi:hypothetical protein
VSTDPITTALDRVRAAETAYRHARCELDARRSDLDAALVALRHRAGSPNRPAGPDRLAALLGDGWTRSRVQRRLDRATKPTSTTTPDSVAGCAGEGDGG